ncbi:IS1634 family transposase, partial [bacterium]|nr:IS1634 family transposase [bacterium]
IITDIDNIVIKKHYDFLDVAVANAIWNFWKLDQIFKINGNKSMQLANIARILTINRCIDPAAKSRVTNWFQKTALPWILNIDTKPVNSSRIFRELSSIEAHKEEICQHLWHVLKQQNPAAMTSVFYDLSSSTFSGSRCILTRWGHCKDGYTHHIVLALVVNKDGLPFYWEVMEGNTADGKTIQWLVKRLKKRFKTVDATLVFDRGMVSDDNLCHLESSGIKYITAMDKNQIEHLSGVDFSGFSDFDPEKMDEEEIVNHQLTKLNNITYYREVGMIGGRRYILVFNPRLFKDQRHARAKAIADFHAFTAELNQELLIATNSRNHDPTYSKFKKKLGRLKLTKFVDVELTEVNVRHEASTSDKERFIRTYQGLVEVDESARREAGKLDGFWLLATNHIQTHDDEYIISSREAITPYRDKFVIESAFRDIKSFIEIEPICVYRDVHVKAHYTLCVLSYLINRTLGLRLKQNNGGHLSNAIVSHERLFDELSSCKINCIEIQDVKLTRFNLTQTTAEQNELLSRLELFSLLDRRLITKINKSVN